MIGQSLEQACMDACLSNGVEYKAVPYDDQWHSTKLIDSNKKGNGRIKFFSDGLGGSCYNWITGRSINFFVNQSNGASVSNEDRAEIEAKQAKRKAKLKAKQDVVAKKAQSLYVSSIPAFPHHPYLKSKHIKPYFLHQGDWVKSVLINGQWQKITIEKVLLVPLYNEVGTIRNVQAIFPEKHPDLARNKDFMAGAELSGLFSWIGDKSDTVCLAEGVATAFTIHEETGFRVYIAFSATNLLAVAKTIRKRLPEAKIILCADHDKSGVGLEKSTEAAKAVDGLVCMPPVVGMDFNDYKNHLQEAK